MMRERPILFAGPMVRAIREGRKTQTRRLVTPAVDLDVVHWEYAPEIERWMGDTTPDLDSGDVSSVVRRCPYGAPGDRLWVRETWGTLPGYDGARVALAYRADRAARDLDRHGTMPELLRRLELSPDLAPLPADVALAVTWRPSSNMPRWASRLTLEVTGVRVERLQEIREADARAEGVDWAAPQYLELEPGDDDREDPREVGYPSAAASFARDNFRRLWDSLNDKSAPWDSNPWVWAITFRVLS